MVRVDRSPSDEELTALLVLARRVATRIVGPATADDVASETVTRALVVWPKMAGYQEAWVTRVATNVALDMLRKQRHRIRVTADSEDANRAEDELVDRIVLARWLGRLSRRQREVVVLRHAVGMSDQEVAGVLRLSAATVRTHRARGLAALRRAHGPLIEEGAHVPD
jgi:RNA polymerase sigma factor (sigma-70 family)